jgi:hypothetical protein
MKLTSWAVLAFVGSLLFLMLFIKDWDGAGRQSPGRGPSSLGDL